MTSWFEELCLQHLSTCKPLILLAHLFFSCAGPIQFDDPHLYQLAIQFGRFGGSVVH